MKVLAVIPARYHSTRLMGKPLIEISGKPLLAHVYENVKDAPSIDKVIIATEDERIMNLAKSIGAQAQMTSDKHETGTDRVVEVASKYPDYDIVLNVQGDNPQVDHDIVHQLTKPFVSNKTIEMTTIKKEITLEEELKNINVVKVVTDVNNIALYFSRSLIPFPRGVKTKTYKHVGLYGFRRDFLMKYAKMKQTPLEKSESLEQLRAMENGAKIYVSEMFRDIFEVNTAEDVSFLEKFI